MKKLPFILLCAVIIFHLGLLFSTSFIDWPEIPLYPWLLHQGLGLYKDVTIAYPPMSVYLLLGYFSLAGFSLLSYQLLTYIIIFCIDSLLFFILIKQRTHIVVSTALLAFYSLLQVSLGGNGLWHELLLAPFMLLTYLSLSTFLRTHLFRYLIVVSILCSFMLLTKQTVIWTILSIGFFLLVYHWIRPWITTKRLAVLLCIPLVSFVTSYLYYYFRGAGEPYLYWVIQYPLLLTQIKNDYAYLPFFHDVRNAIAIYALVFLTPFLLVSKKILTQKKLQIVLTLVFIFSLLAAIFPRWGFFRLQLSLPFMIILIGYLSTYGLRLRKNTSFITLSLLMCLGCLYYERKYILTFFTKDDPTTTPYITHRAKQEAEQLQLVVGNNSLYIWGNKAYYALFIDKTPSIPLWHQHFPWMLEVTNLSQRVVHDIETKQIMFIFMSNEIETLPQLVRDYLNKKFTPVIQLEHNSVLWKRRQ